MIKSDTMENEVEIERIRVLKSSAETFLGPDTPENGKAWWGSRRKEVFDRVVGSIASPFALGLIALCGRAVLKNDGPPIFYISERWHPYYGWVLYTKLRTMIKGADQMEDILSEVLLGARSYEDPRITEFGRILRNTSLDELPQIISVARGNMSIVGPRGFVPIECQYMENRKDIYPYRELLEFLYGGLRYGLIDLSAIFGRNHLSFIEMVILEVLYGQHASFKNDLKIIALAVPTVLSMKGAR